jgi:hypothetical protein
MFELKRARRNCPFPPGIPLQNARRRHCGSNWDESTPPDRECALRSIQEILQSRICHRTDWHAPRNNCPFQRFDPGPHVFSSPSDLPGTGKLQLKCGSTPHISHRHSITDKRRVQAVDPFRECIASESRGRHRIPIPFPHDK